MQIGIFAKTFVRPTVGSNLDAVAASGAQVTQYNLVCAGLPTLPDVIAPDVCEAIRSGHRSRNLEMAAISATFNIIDPDELRRSTNMRRFEVLASAARSLGTEVLTLCSGTCDAEDMWRAHPDNRLPGTWHAMETAMKHIVGIAEAKEVFVAIEPEPGNVVDSAARARHLLNEIGSPRLKIVFDGANLIDSGDPARIREILAEAIELLGSDIVIAHAKDVRWEGEPRFVPAGEGVLDYPFYLECLVNAGFRGPLILHGLDEDDVPRCVRFLKEQVTSFSAKFQLLS